MEEIVISNDFFFVILCLEEGGFMILNISGRTDIVAFYTPWLMNRMNEGFVDVRNPFFPKKVSRIYFKDVDLIVFCTKNPFPILPFLKDIQIPVVFQVTLTPYKKDIEPNVPDKKKVLETILHISNIVGIENVYVRYDPILINDAYTIDYHCRAFEKLCSVLENSVKHVIISFVDIYKNVERNKDVLQLKEITREDFETIGKNFSAIGKKYGIAVQSCYEQDKLEPYGILNIPCVSKELAFRLTGKKFSKWQARDCACVSMVDIGEYNTCSHFCKYCYANYNEKSIKQNILKHDVHSSLLIGTLKESDEIKVRRK